MLGLITEYNPFHNGHLLHIEKSKEITKEKNCIVVMSGNFVQRGEPAIFNKHLRTKMALLNGADIVLELPLIFSTSSAELFALGAVDLLEKTGLVRSLSFGSEEGNIESLSKVANILSNENEIFKNLLKEELKKGITFAKARENTLNKIIGMEIKNISTPNNILGIEYLKALKTLNSKIKPFTIKRIQANFHSNEINGNIASASAIRKAISLENSKDIIKHCMPKNCFDLISDTLPFKPKSLDDYSLILNYILRSKPKEYIKNIADISEGLENRILANIDKFIISDLIKSIKCKRYPYSRIQHILLNILLDIKSSEKALAKQNLNTYIRVLGFKKTSSNLVSKLTESAKVPVLTNIKNAKEILDEEQLYTLNKEVISTDIYNIKNNLALKNEFKNPLVII